MPIPPIEIRVNTSKAKADLTRLKTQIKKLKTYAKRIEIAVTAVQKGGGATALDKALRQTARTVDKYAAAQRKAASDTRKAAQANQQAAQGARAESQSLGKAAQAWQRLAESSGTATGAAIKYARVQRTVTAAVEQGIATQAQANEVLAAYSKRIRTAQVRSQGFTGALLAIREDLSGLRRVAFTLNSLIAAIFFIGYGFKATIGQSAAFNRELSTMVGLTNNSREAIEEMAPKLLDLARKYGQSVEEVTASATMATSVMDASRAINVVKTSAKGAVAGLGNMAATTRLLTGVLRTYSDTGITAAQVMDIITQAVNEGQIEGEEFVSGFGKATAMAHQLGVSFADTAAAMALFTTQNLDAAQSSTLLVNLLKGIQKPAAQSKGVMQSIARAIGDVSFSFSHVQELAKKDFLGALQYVKKGVTEYVDKMHAMGRSNVTVAETLGKIFPNIREYQGYLALVGADAEAAEKTFRNVNNAMGALDLAVHAHDNDTWQKFKRVISAVEEGLMGVGEELEAISQAILPDVTTNLNGLTIAVQALSTAFLGGVIGKSLQVMLTGSKTLFLQARNSIRAWRGVAAAEAAAGVTGVTAQTAVAASARTTTGVLEAEAVAARGLKLSFGLIFTVIGTVVGGLVSWYLAQERVKASAKETSEEYKKIQENAKRLINLGRTSAPVGEQYARAIAVQKSQESFYNLQAESLRSRADLIRSGKMDEELKASATYEEVFGRTLNAAMGKSGNLTQAEMERARSTALEAARKQAFEGVQADLKAATEAADNAKKTAAKLVAAQKDYEANKKKLNPAASEGNDSNNPITTQGQISALRNFIGQLKLKTAQSKAEALAIRGSTQASAEYLAKQMLIKKLMPTMEGNYADTLDYVNKLAMGKAKVVTITAAMTKEEVKAAKAANKAAELNKKAYEAALTYQKQEISNKQGKAVRSVQLQLQDLQAPLGAKNKRQEYIQEQTNRAAQTLSKSGLQEGMQQYDLYIAKVQAAAAAHFDLEQAMKRTQDMVTEVSQTMYQSFSDFFFDPMKKGIKGLALDFVNSIRRAIADSLAELARAQLRKGLMSLLGTAATTTTGTGTGSVAADNAYASAMTAYSGSIFGSAKGNVFRAGNVVPFANGGIVSSPTYFGMSGGRTGLMGEAGTEAVLPLGRTANGQLGVRMIGGGGNSVNYSPSMVINAPGAGPDELARLAMMRRQILQTMQAHYMFYRKNGFFPQVA